MPDSVDDTTPRSSEEPHQEQTQPAPKSITSSDAITKNTAPPSTETTPPLPDEPPPLPEEAPPGSGKDDGWDAFWDEGQQAYYFYNRYTKVTQWENPRVAGNAGEPPPPGVETKESAPGTKEPPLPASLPAKPAGGYDPSIHGDYDPDADYAKGSQNGVLEEPNVPGVPGTDPAETYGTTGTFNRFTGKWQRADINPEKFSDENKSRRQMSAFFDVDAAANTHDGKSLRAERAIQYVVDPQTTDCGSGTKTFQPNSDNHSFRYYLNEPQRSVSSTLPDAPHITVIRPCKGLEPYLYQCLASILQQDYSARRFTVHFCVPSRSDIAYKVVTEVIRDHPDHDARVFVEEEDLNDGSQPPLGPNPKIRNMSRAYREAKGDLIWILDCNIWVSRGVLGRMVDKLCGYSHHGQSTPYKLVHHIPMAVDVDDLTSHSPASRSRPSQAKYDDTSTTPMITSRFTPTFLSTLNKYGGRLDEHFLSTAHAKMYSAISTVAVAPCLNGKSSMFRRSHLDTLTSQLPSPLPTTYKSTTTSQKLTGVDYFSYNICEDHLIGDLLWRNPPPLLADATAQAVLNHGICWSDLAIQPVAGMSVTNYIARRVRWLRVRKFTVPTATFVEPGTESLLCSAYGAFGLTTWDVTSKWCGHTWWAFLSWFLISVIVWACIDWTVYAVLQSGKTIEGKDDVPPFAKRLNGWSRRPLAEWVMAWVGREMLALPIWVWAVCGGVTVTWREKKFWVGMDMKVHEIKKQSETKEKSVYGNGHIVNGKSRRD